MIGHDDAVNEQPRRSLLALGLFVGMVASGLAATFGNYRLGVGSRDLDGAANTIAGVIMVVIGLNEIRRHVTALLRLRRA